MLQVDAYDMQVHRRGRTHIQCVQIKMDWTTIQPIFTILLLCRYWNTTIKLESFLFLLMWSLRESDFICWCLDGSVILMQMYPWMYAFDNINFSLCFRCSFIDSWYGVSQTFRVASSVHCFVHSIYYTSSDINFHTWVRRWSTNIHDHYLAHKISQLTKCLTLFIHFVNYLILSNLALVWSRGINGKTISHTVHDLGIYIDSSINLADHIPRLTTRTFFFKFLNLDLSVRCSLSNFQTHGYYFSRLLQRPSWWKTMRSVSSVYYLASQKRTVPHWLNISAKIAFKIGELAHPCLHGSAPPYLIRTSRQWATSLDAHSHISDRLRWTC